MKLKFGVLLSGLCLSVALFAQSPRNMLTKELSVEQLAQMLVYDQQWVNYPSYEDREGWAKLVSPEMTATVIQLGEKALKHQWIPHLVTDYLAFRRTGAIMTGRDNHMALQALTLAELVEGKGRFMDAIINGTWFMCETSWLHASHTHFQKDKSGLPDRDDPTIELVVADIGAQLAWTHYFFAKEFDKVSLLIDKRIREEVKYRLIDPYYARNDYSWMGFVGTRRVNNWNIWINYNVLQAIMLMEPDKQRVAEGVHKVMRSSDLFINAYQEDGACEEGPTYWGHAGANLFKCLDMLGDITAGKIDVFNEPLVQNIGKYIYRAHVNDSYFVNFADAAAVGSIKPGVVFEYGKRMGDKTMMSFAAYAAQTKGFETRGPSGYMATALDDMCISAEVMKYPAKEPLIASHWFEGTQVCVARDKADTKDGFFFAAKGGHNAESHNHNDIGSCILYYNGSPVLIDAGVGTYTSKTFSSQRYSIWTMQSGYHNLPTINGVDQKNGQEFAAKNARFIDRGNQVRFLTDISNAYPKESGVKSWVRSYTLNRGKSFIIDDSWELASFIAPSTINLMTVCNVEVQKDALLLSCEGFALKMSYDPRLLKPEIETVAFKDRSLKGSWPEGKIYRIQFKILSDKLKTKNVITITPHMKS